MPQVHSTPSCLYAKLTKRNSQVKLKDIRFQDNSDPNLSVYQFKSAMAYTSQEQLPGPSSKAFISKTNSDPNLSSKLLQPQHIHSKSNFQVNLHGIHFQDNSDPNLSVLPIQFSHSTHTHIQRKNPGHPCIYPPSSTTPLPCK